MTFDALETRVNAASMKRLANARAYAVLGDFPVIFDKASAVAIDGTIDTDRPQFQALDSDIAAHGIAHGTPVTVRDVAYLARNPRPDGTGMTLVLLEAA